MPSLAAIAIGATVIGAGISAYGQYQSGQTSQALADYNAHQQREQAAAELSSLQASAAIAARTAEVNFQLRSAEAEARESNARAIEGQALQGDQLSRDNLRKRREEFARLQGTQRATIAASGVVESTGTPLDLLADTAARIQLDQEEQAYANELSRTVLLNEAAQERLGGKLALAGATLDRNSEVAAAGLKDIAARNEYFGALRSATITQLSGAAARESATYQSAGTLFGGLGGAAGQYYDRKPKRV